MRQKKELSFPELQALWYKKLKRDGFDDIEQPDGNLKVWATKAASTMMESKAEYYRMAQQYYHYKNFPTRLDQRVWGLHAKGLSNAQVAYKVKKSTGSVEWHLKKMRRLFGLRWSNKYE